MLKSCQFALESQKTSKKHKSRAFSVINPQLSKIIKVDSLDLTPYKSLQPPFPIPPSFPRLILPFHSISITFPVKFPPKQRNMYFNKRIYFITNIIISNQQMSDDDNFETGDAGSAECTPTAYGDIKKGGYCMLKGFPCKVTEYSTAKPGKHGSAKATIVGNDIFTNKKYEDTAPTGATGAVPNVTKEELEVADIDEDQFVTAILPNGDLKTDLKLPEDDEELFAEFTKVWEGRGDRSVFLTVQRACGKEKYVSIRVKE